MDTISDVLRRAGLDAAVDMRCLLADATRMEIDAHGTRVAPFHLLLEGRCSLHLQGRTIQMSAGDVVLLTGSSSYLVRTPGEGPVRDVVRTQGRSFITTRTAVAETGADDTEPGADDAEPVVDLLCGHFSYGPGAGAILFRSLPDAVHVSLTESVEGDDIVHLLGTLIRLEANKDDVGTAAVLSALCTALLAMILRTSRGRRTESAVWTAVSDEEIAGVIEAIIREPGATWSLARLGKMTRLSRATLIRRFTRSTGMTVGAFIVSARLMAAADLLTGTSLTVADVATRVGYQSESTFSRAFRLAFGLTPARFRKAHKVSR